MSRRVTQRDLAATAKRVEALPASTCPHCLGSGFYDVLDKRTGEVLPMLCHSTPACERHAERARRWFSAMLFFYASVDESEYRQVQP